LSRRVDELESKARAAKRKLLRRKAREAHASAKSRLVRSRAKHAARKLKRSRKVLLKAKRKEKKAVRKAKRRETKVLRKAKIQERKAQHKALKRTKQVTKHALHKAQRSEKKAQRKAKAAAIVAAHMRKDKRKGWMGQYKKDKAIYNKLTGKVLKASSRPSTHQHTKKIHLPTRNIPRKELHKAKKMLASAQKKTKARPVLKDSLLAAQTLAKRTALDDTGQRMLRRVDPLAAQVRSEVGGSLGSPMMRIEDTNESLQVADDVQQDRVPQVGVDGWGVVEDKIVPTTNWG
jgi:hypothetical protein